MEAQHQQRGHPSSSATEAPPNSVAVELGAFDSSQHQRDEGAPVQDQESEALYKQTRRKLKKQEKRWSKRSKKYHNNEEDRIDIRSSIDDGEKSRIEGRNEGEPLLSQKHIFYNYYTTDVDGNIKGERGTEAEMWPQGSGVLIRQLHKRDLFVFVGCLVGFFLLYLTTWRNLTVSAWYALFVVFGSFVLLIKQAASPDLIILFSVTLLLVGKIITPSEALTGFGNSAIVTISVLFIIAEGIAQTGSMALISQYVLGETKGVGAAQARLMIPLTVLSAFTNNTPLTALMIPVVEKFCRSSGIPPSKLMIPLSYATIFGGSCSLIGTSTNLIAAGLAMQRDPSLHFPFFEITPIGIGIAAVGLAYMLLFSRWLLPERHSPMVDYLDHPREYSVTVVVEQDSAAVGKTIGELGLNELEGLSLICLQRGEVSFPGAENTKLYPNDQLLFAGDVSKVIDLFDIKGLKPTNQEFQIVHPSINRLLVEAVISPQSSLIGRTISNINFEEKFNAAVLAVSRGGRSFHQKISTIELAEGDTLLLVCKQSILETNSGSDFITVSKVGGGSLRVDYLRMGIAVATAASMIALSSFEVIDLLTASLSAAFFLLFTRCITIDNAIRASKIRLVIMIASSFAVARALEKTGVAQQLANDLVSIFAPVGDVGLLYGVYLSTAILTAFLSNASSAAVMIPITFSFPSVTTIPFKAFVYAIMVAASADFSTPIGYQTNLMVWGPGGYTFTDFARVGMPLQFMLSIVSVAIIWFLFI